MSGESEHTQKADLRAARQKYLQLGREIASTAMSPDDRSDLQHTHSKLGIFIENVVGTEAWRDV